MPFLMPQVVKSKTFFLGVTGALGALAAGLKVWSDTHDWWKATMAAGFAVWSLIQVSRKDSLAKLESATVMSNLETATRVESAVQQIAPNAGLRNLGGLESIGSSWQPFGGAPSLDGEAVPLAVETGGTEQMMTLGWGDLPADGGA